MIPNSGCDPDINVVIIGAKILEKIKNGVFDIESIMTECSIELNLSADHIILSLDWLFLIGAIENYGDQVFLNDTKILRN